MILHAWRETEGQIRVRLTSTDAIQTNDRVTTYASSTAEVQRLVRLWLESVMGKQDQNASP